MPESEEEFLAPIPTPDEIAKHISLLISTLSNEKLAEKFEMISHLRAIERDTTAAAPTGFCLLFIIY
jgi:ribosomal protein S10